MINAVSYMDDITGVPGMNNAITILGYIEIILLAALLPVWLITCKVWALLENMKRKHKRD